MAKKFVTLTNGWSPERKEKVQRKVNRLIRDERVHQLRNLRQNRDVSQAALAEMLSSTQASVSKIESRNDFYLSTLREYIEALGGQLEIMVRFPEGVVSLGDLNTAKPATKAAARPKHA